MRTWGTPVRLSKRTCVVRVVDHGMQVRHVYVPWRESMEPNLSEAINAALDRVPESPWKAGKRNG